MHKLHLALLDFTIQTLGILHLPLGLLLKLVRPDRHGRL
jgi:hypothetical protein